MTSFPHRSFRATLEHQPHPLLFITVSGSHLYGFPSGDSDFDLRGVHIAPTEELLGLRGLQRETIEFKTYDDGYKGELVTHDVSLSEGRAAKDDLQQLANGVVGGR